jgi:hypothetical protein
MMAKRTNNQSKTPGRCFALTFLALWFLFQPLSYSLGQAPVSKSSFEMIEGVFHDGLGTYAELTLANELIRASSLEQPLYDVAASRAKMADAMARLGSSHPARGVFEREIANIEAACRQGALALIDRARPEALVRVRHVAREYADAKAGDLRLLLDQGHEVPVSVKTDKSNKVAVAEGQTPQIGPKWAERYFRVTPVELNAIIAELGFSSMTEVKSHYLNAARLAAEVMIRKLGIVDWQPKDFSRARARNLAAVKYLLTQLLAYKKGSDGSRVIILDRQTGEVRWESILDGIDVERLTLDRVSFLPSRPRGNRPIASEFGIKIDGRTVVSFQIKHKRGSARGTARQYEFSDITTRLRI